MQLLTTVFRIKRYEDQLQQSLQFIVNSHSPVVRESTNSS